MNDTQTWLTGLTVVVSSVAIAMAWKASSRAKKAQDLANEIQSDWLALDQARRDDEKAELDYARSKREAEEAAARIAEMTVRWADDEFALANHGPSNAWDVAWTITSHLRGDLTDANYGDGRRHTAELKPGHASVQDLSMVMGLGTVIVDVSWTDGRGKRRASTALDMKKRIVLEDQEDA